ncbi:MAG: hypothetical protein KDB03_02615, partial [Planctomycetales bacterium]|nr:hypothetical protein [Planctomycetales bacterium]
MLNRKTCKFAGWFLLGCQGLVGVGSMHAQQPGESSLPAVGEPVYMNIARLKIPFSLDSLSTEAKELQLWVSTDEGKHWQMHGVASPQDKFFGFQAAAEGMYLFSVQTVDQQGNVFPSNSPPLRVYIDTSTPVVELSADTDAVGRVAVRALIKEKFLRTGSAELRYRTDSNRQWQVADLQWGPASGEGAECSATVDVMPCREVALVFSVQDQANNLGQATFQLSMPRTAAGANEMRLASQPTTNSAEGPKPSAIVSHDNWQMGSSRIPSFGGTPWDVASESSSASNSAGLPLKSTVDHLAAKSALDLMAPTGIAAAVEELPAPHPQAGSPLSSVSPNGQRPVSTEYPSIRDLSNPDLLSSRDGRQVPEATPEKDSEAATPFGQAYHCNARAFSLDYSVDSLGGGAVARVELWGTEDGGRAWQQWGSDPDRQSPFDVQVGNDGLFGFRMVVVSANGLVGNLPRNGDSADVWINVDTQLPTATITRAVYGEGAESGMLVIDYSCQDANLSDKPIAIAFSETREGPWSTIAAGQKNTGIYLWKANPN